MSTSYVPVHLPTLTTDICTIQDSVFWCDTVFIKARNKKIKTLQQQPGILLRLLLEQDFSSFLATSSQYLSCWKNPIFFSASLTLLHSRTTCALCFLSFAYQISSQNEWPNLLQTEKLNENNTSAKFFANREVKWKMPVSVGSPSTLNYYLSWPVLTFVLSLWLINKTSHKFWSCIWSCVADNVNKSWGLSLWLFWQPNSSKILWFLMSCLF